MTPSNRSGSARGSAAHANLSGIPDRAPRAPCTNCRRSDGCEHAIRSNDQQTGTSPAFGTARGREARAMSEVPAARSALRILRHLAAAGGPVHASSMALALELPRSSVYQLLRVLQDEGFVVHYPEARTYGLGP